MRSMMKIVCFAWGVLMMGNVHAVSAEKADAGMRMSPAPEGKEYAAVQNKLARGWNTWDTRSVLSHVLMPEGFALDLQIRSDETGRVLEQALIGRRGADEEKIRPGPHAYGGSYTDLTLQWQGVDVRVQSAAAGGDFYVLVTPQGKDGKPGTLIVKPGMLFGRQGAISVEDKIIKARFESKTLVVYALGGKSNDSKTIGYPHVSISLGGEAALSTNPKRSIKDIKKIVEAARRKLVREGDKYGKLRDLHDAMQSVLAWNVIYEPLKGRVIVPVSRAWSVGWGGYVLFDWDTYFAAYMLSLDSRELAYANAVEVTKGITDAGFVPNYAGAGSSSLDRSQPPVGSLIVREIYRRYHEKWFLRDVFDDLLRWNRWWEKNRVTDGYLCWGSNPFKGQYAKLSEATAINAWQGAAWESGLDNSPMYDGVPFDTKHHQLKLADVGLISFYISDCDALADIARVLGKSAEADELKERADKYRKALGTLWDEEAGFYYNKHTDTKELSRRVSPTNFYPLLAKAPTQEQAVRMIRGHFYNPDEFWGEWILPSISRDDKAFGDNTYWRGRIWAPMNFLVYMGLRNYGLPQARKDLVEKSGKLLLSSWLGEGHVCENYNSVTGVGSDVGNSDMFYHWGALLGFVSFIENSYVPAPEKPLR